MPADSNIFSQYLKAPKSIQEYQADADQAQARKNALQLAAMDLSEKTQANTRAQQVRAALMGLGGSATDEQRISALRSTATPEGFSQADALEKSLLERQKTGAQVKKDTAEADAKNAEVKWKLADRHAQQLAFVKTPEDAVAYIDEGIREGSLPAQGRERALALIQQNGLEAWKQMAYQAAVPTVEKFKQEAENARNALTNKTSRENNAATNATHVQTTSMTNATSRANNRDTLAQSDRHFQAGQDSPQYMQTDAGLVALPKKVPAGGAIAPTIITGPGGESLGKPLKDIPPAVNSAIITNTQSLNQLDRALTLLEGKNIGDPAKGGQRGDAAATGVKGYLPQGILNRVDPKGVDARAEVADIGSLKIHDRSGAAVTVSESPRLMPFVPTATDDAATVQKKLRRLRNEIANEARLYAETYSKEQGYKPSPAKPTAPAASTGGMPSADAIEAELRRRAGGK